jgi:hypothetical protein
MSPLKIILGLVLLAPVPAAAQPSHDEHHAPTASSGLQSPQSIRHEHEELLAVLKQASAESGDLGVSARALRDVLTPHFRREEEIATPPLGLLRPLASGPVTPQMRAVLPMTTALERELPQMLAEHRRIGAARTALETAARAANRPEYVAFAQTLAAHARQEEEVLYPAAILVGRYISGQSGAR